ncbi:MAG: ABC transporter permease, partial [Chthoniobacterales bacterium]
MNDLRYAFRQLLKSPGFALIAVLTLALGIGASTAIFSVLDAVLLRPLPYPQQERLVELRELDENGKGMEFAQPNFDDLRTRSRSFEAIAKYAGGPEAVIGGSEPLQTNVCAVSGDFFSVLAVRPVLGRFFSSKSLTENKQVAVVSFGFWKRLLGGRTDLAGTTLRLENRSFAVVGVLPAEREFPPDVDVWIPTEIYPPGTSRAAHSWHVVARLRNGVSIKQARTEIASIGRRLKGEYGKQTDMVSFGLSPLRDRLVKDVRGMLLVLAGAVTLVLVIACSNVANLLLVRTTVRHKEIALRAALGASRWRLARQFLVETMLLTLCAGALGVLFAFWGVDLMVGLYHGDLPRVGEIGVNIPVLLFSLGLSVIVGISLGLVPVLGTSSQHLQSHLQNAGRGLTPGSSGTRGRNLLIVFQVALTLMLLVGAGLLGRSFQRLLAVDPGFQPESAVAMSLWTQFSQEPAAQRQPAQFYHKLIERLQTLPGVIA